MDSARWMAEITYRHGREPSIVQFEEIAELHDIVELGPNWNTIEQIVITLNRPSVDPRPDEPISPPGKDIPIEAS